MAGRKKITIKKPEILSLKEDKRVAIHAYEIWQKKGCSHGDDWADWFEAEKIVKANKK